MAINHKIGQTYNGGAGQMSSVSRTLTGSGELRISESIPAASTNLPVAFAVDSDAILSLGIYRDKALTLKPISSGSTTDTIALAAGQLIVWGSDQSTLSEMVFTADVTALYVTNAGASAATLRIEVLTDVTP